MILLIKEVFALRVTFCGHRRISDPSSVVNSLKKVVTDLISEGATEFYLGGYGEFDAFAARIVFEMKATHPGITSTLILAYLNQNFDSNYYDGTVYPPLEAVPKKFAIARRNEWMVDQADVIVAYVTHDFGGAVAMLRYAKRKKKLIISLAQKGFGI